MGFGDKLKGLRDQAQQTVAENKDRIQDAVQVAGDIANTKTQGKYANKIGKVGMKVEAGLDKFAAEGSEAGGGAPAAEAAGGAPAAEAAAPEAAAPAPAAPEPAAPTGEPPTFEDHPPASAAPTEHDPAAASDTAGSAFPDFE